jgi:hypothetical protein
MAAKLSNRQRHERFCAYTHVRVAWFFVAFCALEVYSSWKAVDRPIVRPSPFNLVFYSLIVVAYAPIFLMIFRCFAERFVIAIATAHMTMAVISGFGPGLFDPLTHVISWCFFALWIIALILSMRMPIHAIRNPYFAPEGEEPLREKKGLLIMGAVIVLVFLLGAALYWVPLR